MSSGPSGGLALCITCLPAKAFLWVTVPVFHKQDFGGMTDLFEGKWLEIYL